MSDYIISCTSTIDLSAEHVASRNLKFIKFHYMLGGKEFVDDLGITMPLEEFYERMDRGEMTKTSQPGIGDYVEYFNELLKEGKKIIHVCLSSGLSGDFNSASLACKEISAINPDAKIVVIDSRGASAGYGLLMDRLADLRDEGMSFEDLCAWTEEHKLEVHHWFFSTDLKYYVRGGRITPIAGFMGNLLNICPLLNMDEPGHLVPRLKIHGTKKVQKEIVNKMVENAFDGVDYCEKVFVSSSTPELAFPVVRMVEETFPKMKGKVNVSWIGTTIGSHTGPGTVALFFWGKKRD